MALTKERNSNIELLRILLMFSIVMHHITIHGGILEAGQNYSTCLLVASIFMPLGKIAFDAFIIISAWYTTEGNFNGKRFLKIWLEVLFYNILMNSTSVALGGGVTPKAIIGGLFPILGNTHGFAKTYLIFLLILPILQKISGKLTKLNIISLICLIFGLQIAEKGIMGFTDGVTYVVVADELQVFVLIWLICLLIRKYYISRMLKINCIWYLTFITVAWASLSAMCYFLYFDKSIVGTLYNKLFTNENSPFNIVVGFAVVLLFFKFTPRTNRMINKMAVGTFGVLLIHDNNYFRYVIWDKIIRVYNWYAFSFGKMIVYIIICALIVFIICEVIDLIRQKLECVLMKTKAASLIENKLELFFKIVD